MKKILVITGSRSDYGLLKPLIQTLIKRTELKVYVLVTGMHTLKTYGLTIGEIIKDEIPVNHIVRINPNNNMIEWLSKEIVGINNFCEKIQPDMIVVLGDRDEALAGALVGSHVGIPVAHVHGGDTTGEVTVDDKLRDAITTLSTIHFPAFESSAKRIFQIVGKQKTKHLLITGQLALEGINRCIDNKEIICKRYGISGEKPFILFVMHPSPLDKTPFIKQINPVLSALGKINADILGIFPNSDTGSNLFVNKIKSKRIFRGLYTSLPRNDYLSLLSNCDVIVGNSSSGVLEAPKLLTPVVNIGKRQEDRVKSRYIKNVSYNQDQIFSAIKEQIRNKKNIKNIFFSNIKPSILIADYIESYFKKTLKTR
ncbi:MAG: UDP-N-acetylglucosamine 2-epimerase [Actinobacteria bacterium]|nr:UDP-N-acetylglucosamine 2-epimerase [Actinomycetota bacterium]